MFDRRALEAFRSHLTVAAGGFGAEARALLHKTAHEERARVLREQRQRAGVMPTDIAIPDGHRGAPIEQAQAEVVIEYGYLREVALAVLTALIQASPKRTGDFARGWVILLDGVEIEALDAITHASREVVVVNTRPYARRLEVGKDADGKPFVINAEYKFIERTAIAMRRRFGNVAQLWFNYFDLAAPYILKGGGGRRVAYKQNRRSSGHRAGQESRVVGAGRRGEAMRYPGVRIVRL
jgi:hypothetical protein